jgi:acetyltransferase-like isoleucine patch superfamily enzyme
VEIMRRRRFGIRQTIGSIFAYVRLFVFYSIKMLLGSENANIYLTGLDSVSLKLILRKNGATIGSGCDIQPGLTFHNCSSYENLIIGNDAHIGKKCILDLRDRITIGNRVTISMNCVIITHQDVGKSNLRTRLPEQKAPVNINDDVYIGASCTILMGVTINESSVVGASSLVNKSIKSNVIAAGIPARIMKEF